MIRHQMTNTLYFVFENFRFDIMLIGTCRANRKGWPSDKLNMTKAAGRGTFKMGICPESKVAVYQWCDSRVVNVVSTYLTFEIGSIRRQTGSQ